MVTEIRDAMFWGASIAWCLWAAGSVLFLNLVGDYMAGSFPRTAELCGCDLRI